MRRTREITEEMVSDFQMSMNDLLNEVRRFQSRQREFERSEWLGGSQEEDNYEAPPFRCQEAMRYVRRALTMLEEADHEIAMFRAESGIDSSD